MNPTTPSVFVRLAAGLLLAASVGHSPAAGKSEHVLLVVWDGMRPDFVTPQYTPTLYALAKEGVFFKNHHAVFVSSTEVNGTTLATGVYPNRSGIVANNEYRPEMSWLGPLATEGVEMIRRGDMMTGGNYIRSRTVAEILHEQGIATAVAGTKPVALMHDRAAKRRGVATNSPVLYNGRTIPAALLDPVEKANGDKKFPTNATPNAGRDEWTVKGLTQVLWKKEVPKFTVLWLSEPDASQHAGSPGSDTALGALESSDKRLASVLKALEEKKVRDKTDIMVVSDHGFSSIVRGYNLADILKKAGFDATKRFDDAEPGDVMVVGLGGSAMIYVVDREETTVRGIVEFLQGTEIIGSIFTRIPIEGAFPLSAVRLDPTNTMPDIVISFRWWADKNEYGVPGTLFSEGGGRGGGTHASLSRFDMRNTLVAHGPNFRKGFINKLPSGNADVAPTVLALLGVKPPQPMDGRVLTEALVGGSAPAGEPRTTTIETSRDLGLREWKQYLKTTTFGGAFYIDEGNGESAQK